MNLLPGVRSETVQTDRLRIRYLESGPADGIPVVMIHGNLATSRFFEHLMPGAPKTYRLIAPDMRGFGDTERVPIDSTRGLRDWADDAHSLVRALRITRPLHLVGWSTGGAAIAAYAMDRLVASLTFVDPVSPYGFGGLKLDGTPCFPDYAGSGGGTGSPDFTKQIAGHDTGSESPFSPRNVMNTSYWAPTHREPAEREDMLVGEILKSVTGDDGYPGDATPSPNWPGIAPGTRGILNALSGKYCNWAGIVDIDPKPPILWTHGTADIVVADGSAWEMGTLGKMGVVPGWPGEDAFPPQPMVTQIRNVLESYRRAGGSVQIEMFEGSGHGPIFDAAEQWTKLFFAFLDSVGELTRHGLRGPTSIGVAALCAMTIGCSQTPSVAKPAIGDGCLIGSWVLDHEENRSGYLYGGTPVPVTGLAGARLTFGADGSETEVFDGSAPLVGTAADGRVLSITIGGSVTYRIHADGGQYVETGTLTSLPTVATIGGVPVTGYESHDSPGTGSYQCSTQSFTTKGSNGVQTDTWSRP